MSNTDSVFVAALLWTKLPSSNGIILENLMQTIENDPILIKVIHRINVDNSYCRTLLQHNSMQVKVPSCSVFVLKYPQQHPQVYHISEANHVFDQVRNYYHKLSPGTTPPPKAKSVKISHQLDWIPELNEQVRINPGEWIQFNSTENRDIVEVNRSWKPIMNPRINLKKSKSTEKVSFDQAGSYYLTSRKEPSIQLVVQVGPESPKFEKLAKEHKTPKPQKSVRRVRHVTSIQKDRNQICDDIIGGITDAQSIHDKGVSTEEDKPVPKKTFAQRRIIKKVSKPSDSTPVTELLDGLAAVPSTYDDSSNSNKDWFDTFSNEDIDRIRKVTEEFKDQLSSFS